MNCHCGASLTYIGLIHVECTGPGCPNYAVDKTADPSLLSWEEAYTKACHEPHLHWRSRKVGSGPYGWVSGRPEAWFNYPDLRGGYEWEVIVQK